MSVQFKPPLPCQQRSLEGDETRVFSKICTKMQSAVNAQPRRASKIGSIVAIAFVALKIARPHTAPFIPPHSYRRIHTAPLTEINAMKTVLQKAFIQSTAAGALAMLMAGCTAQTVPPPTPEASATVAPDTRTALACTVPSNCVNSFDSSGLAPLRFEGPPAQALAALRATLAEFPEAKIIQTDALSMEVVFTTAVGFRDLVDFKIDAQAQRIDYRSRSSFGLYDFGKNRSRMTAFASRFAQVVQR